MAEEDYNVEAEVKLFLTEHYLRRLSAIELTELFTTISNQFTLHLSDCKDVEILKSLQTYLRLITDEIKAREYPGAPGT